MPTSRFDPDDALVPATPRGYADPTEFRYPFPVLVGLVLVMVPVAALGFGALFYAAQGPEGLASLVEVRESAASVTVTVRSASVGVAAVGATVAVTVLHEFVHGVAYRVRGYEVSYGAAPRLGAFYAAAFHQFQTRDDNVLVGLAPLVVLDAVLAALLFAPRPLVAFAAFVGLVFNTAGAAGDLYLVARLLRMPPGTLLYDSDPTHSLVFYPAR